MRTRGEAIKLVKRIFGRQRTDITSEMRDEMARLYIEDKMSIRQLGLRYGLTNGAIRSLLKTRKVGFRSTSEGLRIRYPNGRNGSDASNWRGGRRRVGTKGAYICVYSPGHPHKTTEGYVMEHRIVMEKFLGRYLTPKEVVNHINGDKKDNRLENLELVSDRGTHTREHFIRSNRTRKAELEADRLRELLIKHGIDPDESVDK